jgi:hypothetical protein
MQYLFGLIVKMVLNIFIGDFFQADVLEGLLEGGQQDNMIGLSVEKKASLIPRVSQE